MCNGELQINSLRFSGISLIFGILLSGISANVIVSGEQIISSLPIEIGHYIVSFLRYDLQTFDCVRRSSKYWKRICDSDRISLRVLENIREQNYELPQDYNKKELGLYKKQLCATLPRHRKFLELFRHNYYFCARNKNPQQEMSFIREYLVCDCFIKKREIGILLEKNFKISIQEGINQNQITVAIKDLFENEKKYLFCYDLSSDNKIRTFFSEVEKVESAFSYLPISNYEFGKDFKHYVDLLCVYIIATKNDENKIPKEKKEIIKKVVNLTNFHGESVLHGLCQNYGPWSDSERVRLIADFIKYGANSNQSDCARGPYIDGFTPFDYVCRMMSSREIIMLLLQHGARTNLKHECGRKLLKWARENQLSRAQGILKLVEESCDPIQLKKFDEEQNSCSVKIWEETDPNINNTDVGDMRVLVNEYGTWVVALLIATYYFFFK